MNMRKCMGEFSLYLTLSNKAYIVHLHNLFALPVIQKLYYVSY